MKEIQNILQAFTLPAYQEIPDVGLYLDQVTKYINSYLENYPEMLVTPSMIANYVKQKMLKRENKKTYTRDEISGLFIIVLTKTVLSLDHIRILNSEMKEDRFETMYTSLRHHLLSSVKDLSYHDNQDILADIASAIAHKMYLERYFENRKDS